MVAAPQALRNIFTPVGNARYVRGSLEANLKTGITEGHTALTAAMSELGLVLLSESSDELSGQFTYSTNDGEKVSITTSYFTESFTQIEIRVG